MSDRTQHTGPEEMQGSQLLFQASRWGTPQARAKPARAARTIHQLSQLGR